MGSVTHQNIDFPILTLSFVAAEMVRVSQKVRLSEISFFMLVGAR